MRTIGATLLLPATAILFAQASLSPASAQLAPDRFEPNNSFTNASPLASAGNVVETNLTVFAPGDEDVFAFSSAWSGNLQINIAFTNSIGDLDMRLYDSRSNEIASSTTRLDNERIERAVKGGSNFLLRVYGYNSATNNYDLTITGPALTPDLLEPNDSLSSASGLGTVACRAFTNLTVHAAGDVDCFRLKTAGTGTLSVDARFRHSAGDLNLRLYDAASNELAASTGTTNVEHVSWPVVEAATYYIRVEGAGAASNEYDLVLDGPPYPGDRFEPNNGTNGATWLGTVGTIAVSNLSIHATNDCDWYRLTAAERGILKIEIFFTNSTGNLDMQLFDAASNLLASSTGTSNKETVTNHVEGGSNFHVRVYGAGGSVTNVYSLSAVVTPYAGDRYEPDDSFAQARDLGVMRILASTGLSIHSPGNYDYYRFTPAYPGNLRVDILFVNAVGDLDLRFCDSAQAVLATSQGAVDNESVTWPVHPGSNYYVRVDEWAGDTNSYDMIITGPGPTVIGTAAGGGSNAIVMSWLSADGSVYCIEQSTNLVAGFDSTNSAGIPATPSVNTCTVTVDTAVSAGFFRVKEQ